LTKTEALQATPIELEALLVTFTLKPTPEEKHKNDIIDWVREFQ
jgi:hypothetical protein